MAKRKHRETGPAASGRKTGSKSTGNNLLLTIGVGVLVLGLLAFGTFQLFGPAQSQGTNAAAAIAAGNETLESVSLDEGRNLEPAAAAPVTDRETRYLGPATDAAALAQAEAGEIGQPTLVFFHADW